VGFDLVCIEKENDAFDLSSGKGGFWGGGGGKFGRGGFSLFEGSPKFTGKICDCTFCLEKSRKK